MWDRIIRGARVVDPKNGFDGIADVAVEDGRVAAVATSLAGRAKLDEEADGLVLMPGLIDSHLHLGSVFGSAYGQRMAALAGVTTCLDMAGPFTDILGTIPYAGAGINVASIEGFSPDDVFGTLTPSRGELRSWLEKTVEAGSVGVKLMGGHWPLPLETCRNVVEIANEMGVYVAWHAGSTTAGSNIEGMREVIDAVKGLKLHLAHINAYCRGRINPVEEEAAEAIRLLIENPNIWSEGYVSPMNGTILTCDEKGEVIDHVTRTCLKTYGFPITAEGIRGAIRKGVLFVVRDTGIISDLAGGEEAIRLWEAAGTKTAGSFPVNPALSRLMIAEAKRPDGTFVVDAISTDGGCIPRNVQISIGLSLVKFGALTLSEFVQKTSLNPARHLRLFDRGHLTPGEAAADMTLFRLETQEVVETIVGGRTVMKKGELTGRGASLITTKHGRASLESQGFRVIETRFDDAEPERIRI